MKEFTAFFFRIVDSKHNVCGYGWSTKLHLNKVYIELERKGYMMLITQIYTLSKNQYNIYYYR